MNNRIRKLFEEYTVPNFGIDAGILFNENGEYINPAIEDHWQTFQEAAELIVQECARVAVATPCPITDEVSLQSQGHTWDMACVEAGRAIKQQFGSQQ